LFRYGESVIDLYPQIPDSALNFGVTQQQLHGAQVAGAAIDEYRFGSA